MGTLTENFNQVLARISRAEHAAGRPAGSVRLLAVSKTKPMSLIQEALSLGQSEFGENYLQDALPKIEQLQGQPITWHFIGQIQANKTRSIAENFDWVQGLDRMRIARRLSDQLHPHISLL